MYVCIYVYVYEEAQPPAQPSSSVIILLSHHLPTYLPTALSRWAPWSLQLLSYPLRHLALRTPTEGARPILFLAASERVEGRGGGFWMAQASKYELYEVGR